MFSPVSKDGSEELVLSHYGDIGEPAPGRHRVHGDEAAARVHVVRESVARVASVVQRRQAPLSAPKGTRSCAVHDVHEAEQRYA